MFLALAIAKLAPHFPADPEQQQAAGQEQADDRQQIDCDAGKENTQNGCGQNADDDRLTPLRGLEAGSGKTDNHGVVAGENKVDSDDLQQSRQTGCREDVHMNVPNASSAVLASR